MSNIRKIDIWGIPSTEHEPFSGAWTMYIRERFVLCIQNNLQDLSQTPLGHRVFTLLLAKSGV